MTAFLLALISSSLSVSLLMGLMLMFRGPLLSRYRARTIYYIGLMLIVLLLFPWRSSMLPGAQVEMGAVEVGLSRPLMTEPVALSVDAQISLEAAVSEPVYQPTQSKAPTVQPIRLEQLLFALWLFGALIALAVRIYRHMYFLHSVRRWKSPPNELLQSAVKSTCEDMNMKVMPAWHTPLLSSPTVVGLVRPMLLFPDAQMTPDQLSLALRHELCHVRQGDLWGKLLIEMAMIVHWFNPFLLVARRALSALCEMACDEAVLKGHDHSSRALYLEIMLSTLSADFCPPISTRFDGGVKTMKFRIERLFDTRPRKLGLVIVALALILALCTGNVLAASTNTNPLDKRDPVSSFGSPADRMSDEDYLFVMGLKRPDLEQLTLEEWHELLKPDLSRLNNIYNHHAMENRFMEMLRCDMEEMSRFPSEMSETWDSASDVRSSLTGPDQYLYFSYAIRWHVPDPATVTVGQRNAVMDAIRSDVNYEFALQCMTDADKEQIWKAMYAFLKKLSEKYSDDGFEIQLRVRSSSAEAYEPIGDYPEDELQYLMGFQAPGYLQMSVEAFNQTLLTDQERLWVLMNKYYSTHWFIRTLGHSVLEVRQIPRCFLGFGTSESGFDCNMTLSWDIPDPGKITVAERDTLLNRAGNLVQIEYRKYSSEDLPRDTVAAYIEQACQTIANQVSGDTMTISFGDIEVTESEH